MSPLEGRGAPADPLPSRPNILFRRADDMADWSPGFALPGYPASRAPILQRLMERGTMFTPADCASPVCGPLRAILRFVNPGMD